MAQGSSTGLRGMLTQFAGVAVIVGVGALLMIGVATLVFPEEPGHDLLASADGTGLPTPEDLPGLGAVLVAAGRPVDDGMIQGQFAFSEGGVGSEPAWDVTISFSGGRGSGESLRVRWSWHDGDIGGEIRDVWALFSVRAGSFVADQGECHVDLVRFQSYEETVEVPRQVEEEVVEGTDEVSEFEIPIPPAETYTVEEVDLAGSIACEDVPGRRAGESISFQAVFNIPG